MYACFICCILYYSNHDDVIKWKLCPRYWSFLRGNHRSLVNSPHKGQWRGALVFSLICAWTNGWVNNHEAGDLRRHRAHYGVTVMTISQNVYNSVIPFSMLTSAICNCARQEKNAEKLKRVVRDYNKAMEDLLATGRYETRDDFTVVFQPFMQNVEMPTLVRFTDLWEI